MELKPGYKQTEVGVIPEDWGINGLENVCVSKGLVRGPFGGALKKEYFVRNGFKVFEQKNAIYGDSNLGDYFIDVQKFSELKRFELLPGDFIVSCSGTIGKIFLVPENAPRGVINQALLKITTDDNEISKQFFLHYFKWEKFQERIIDSTQGGAMKNLVGMSIFKKTKIPLPPTKAEQEAIANALSDADALIQSLTRLIAKKRQIKQGAMQTLLNPYENGQLKAGWVVKELGELIAHCSSGATPYRGISSFYKGDIKWITSGELNYNVIEDTIEKISIHAVEKTNLKIHPIGTFLMAITGLEAEGTRGACGIVGSPATTNQSCMAIYPNKELIIDYLYHYYVYKGKELALKYCQGTKQQSYTAKLVKILPIALPQVTKEQMHIACILFDMDAEIAALEAKLAKYQQIKQGMMQNLLTGRIRLVKPENKTGAVA
jgi:type I restriction enzyme S subunit